jgi:hypothetical protein
MQSKKIRARRVLQHGRSPSNEFLGFHDPTTYSHPLHIQQKCTSSVDCRHQRRRSPIIIFYISKYLVDGLKILVARDEWCRLSLAAGSEVAALRRQARRRITERV